jgi:hypothetical protein
VTRRSVVPALVALVCFGPLLLAIALRYGPFDLSWLPTLPGSRELVAPPIATPEGWLGSAHDGAGAPYRWFLIYARMSACDQACARDLERLRQVQAALGQDVDRVQRVFLHVGAQIAHDPALELRSLEGPPGEELARALEIDADVLSRGRVYIGDPQGRLVAGYPGDVAQKELLRDLKRLLGAGGTNR